MDSTGLQSNGVHRRAEESTGRQSIGLDGNAWEGMRKEPHRNALERTGQHGNAPECTGVHRSATDSKGINFERGTQMATKISEPVTAIAPVSNGAKEIIETGLPYSVRVTIEGVAPYLFHAWNNEAVRAKGSAAKGSKAKKSDDLESYVYRTDKGTLGMRGVALHRAICEMGRFHQDPRSPRKSAVDLLKAAVVPTTILADTGAKTWDYVDRQRVVIQRSAVTRERPALKEGWRVTFDLLVNVPEYVSPHWLHELLIQAGRLNGIGDFRPTYGRFQVTEFKVS